MLVVGRSMGIELAIPKLRRSMPLAVRKVYRLWKSATVTPPTSPGIPDALFKEARLLPSREKLIASLPKARRVLEIGTDTGNFARTILNVAAPARLDVIDIDYSNFDEQLCREDRIVRHQGRSTEILATFQPETFDWIYIDASHRYENVLADAYAAARIVHQGGFLLFNDFAHIDPFLGRYGVHRAVSEFLVEMRWSIHALSFDRFGLYDIAIRSAEGRAVE